MKTYELIKDEKLPARFLIAKSLDYNSNSTEVHKILNELKEGEKIDLEVKEDNLLKRKIDEARKMYFSCELCEIKCRVNRYEKPGFCKNTVEPYIASMFEHYGEETPLVPSFTIFFSGCNFRCVYCQNWDISQQIIGEYIPPNILAKIIEIKRRNNLIENINFVGGEPTPHIPYILEVLDNLNVSIPVIFNTNFYLTEKSIKILDGVVDLWLPDFKYGNNKCAEKYSGIKNYFEIITRNFKLIENKGDILIRHLILPNHIECCSMKIVDWLANNMDKNSFVINIMKQYWPAYKAKNFKEINRKISIKEYLKVVNYAKEKGLTILE